MMGANTPMFFGCHGGVFVSVCERLSKWNVPPSYVIHTSFGAPTESESTFFGRLPMFVCEPFAGSVKTTPPLRGACQILLNWSMPTIPLEPVLMKAAPEVSPFVDHVMSSWFDVAILFASKTSNQYGSRFPSFES